MSEPVLLGLGIIILMVGWHFVVRKTALDTFRDGLFDLRESVRQFYLEKGYGLEDRTYAQLRLLINSQIRYLEQASMMGLGISQSEYQKNKELRECMDEWFKDRFKTDNPELAAFIKGARIQAHRHITGYLIFSSLGLTSVTSVIFPVVVSVAIAHRSFQLSKRGMGDALYLVSRKFANRDLIEKLSSLNHIRARC